MITRDRGYVSPKNSFAMNSEFFGIHMNSCVSRYFRILYDFLRSLACIEASIYGLLYIYIYIYIHTRRVGPGLRSPYVASLLRFQPGLGQGEGLD